MRNPLDTLRAARYRAEAARSYFLPGGENAGPPAGGDIHRPHWRRNGPPDQPFSQLEVDAAPNTVRERLTEIKDLLLSPESNLPTRTRGG